MKRRSKFKIIVLCLIALSAALAAGLRHEVRHPNQHMNQYWAVRSLSIWTFFGVEVHARNKFAVYDMDGRTTRDLPVPINQVEVQVRRLGKVVEGGFQYNLGEDNYDDDGCIDYIYCALGSSLNASHRIEATSVFRRSLERYPLTSKLKDSLVSDPSEAVRSQMQTVLAYSH